MSWRPQALLAGLASILTLLVWNNPGTAAVEGLIYNWKCRLVSFNDPPDDEIVVVTITDACLHNMRDIGRWPWPRSIMAAIVDYCSGARVIGMDILFSERGESDQALAEQMRESSNVVSSIYLSGQAFDPLPPAKLDRLHLAHWPVSEDAEPFQTVIHPIDEIMEASASMGYVNFWRSSVNGSHSLKLATRLGERQLPSLALASFLVGQGLKPSDAVLEDGWLRVGEHRVKIDAEDNLLLRWKQGGDFQSVEAHEIIESFKNEMRGHAPSVPRAAFEDKIVLIGMEASGLLRDREITPVDQEMPGVYIHATAMDNLLNNEYMTVLPRKWTLALILLFGLLPAIGRPEKPGTVFTSYVFLASLLVVSGLLLLFLKNLMAPTLAPLMALTLSTGFIGLFQWRKEQAQLERMKALEVQKQQFTDMLVHDLKNTVAPVLMSVDLAKSAPDGDFARKEFPYYVEQTYNQLLLQVNSLLDIRRMEEGRLKLKPSLVSPLALMYEIRDTYSGAQERMDLHLDVEESEAAQTELLLDPIVVRRVLENLIWNALKYATHGTPIDIRSGVDGPDYLIRISNQCHPIDPEKLNLIFGRFVVGDAPRTIGNITSSGLGLAFCKLAVEGHKGSIEIASPVPGREEGFQVEVRLPIIPENTPG